MLFKRIDKYILGEFWLPLVSGAGIITGVWLGIDKFKQVFKLLAKSGASLDTGFIILGLETPRILGLTLPISLLLATFLTFQKLSSQSEILAMRASGFSFGQVMRPVAYLGIIGILFCFLLNEVVVPITSPFSKKTYALALYKDPVAKNLRGFSYFEKNPRGELKRIFYVKSYKDAILKGITILDFSEDLGSGGRRLSLIYTADLASWNPEKGGWELHEGTSTYIKKEIKKPKPGDVSGGKPMHIITNFERTFIPSGVNPREILKNMSKYKDMNAFELQKFISLHKNIETQKLNEAKTKFHNRFAYPVSCLLLSIIGACLGILERRRNISWGYIVIGLVVFIFYMSQTIFDSFGNTGRIEPMIAAWLTNFVLSFIAGGLYLYRARS